MKRRAVELARRRAALIQRSAVQRALLADEVTLIAVRLERIDVRIDAVRRFFSRPWLLLGGAVALLVLLGPRKIMRVGTRGAVWFGTAQRVLRLLRSRESQA